MPKHTNLLGKKFGRLTVVGYHGREHGHATWKCLCRCGTRKIVAANHLKNGHTRSCGCLAREITSRRAFRHGRTNTPEYRVWAGIIQRCENPNRSNWPRYGGRGITVDPRWRKFENFFADMGPRPEGKSIDRINPDGPYTRANCRWATPKEQNNNKHCWGCLKAA